MSIQAVEQLESRTIAKRGGKLTATRTFHVWNDAAPIETPAAVIAAFGTSGLPVAGFEFPESPNLLARDYDIARAPGHRDLWIVRWEYSELGVGGLDIPEVEPGQPGYVDITASISASRVEAWRSLTYGQLAALTSSGGPYPQGTNNTGGDIGGDPIDASGEPTQDVVRQVEITVTETRNGIPNLLFLLPYAWTRNNNRFLGAPIGQLLYVGATVNRIDINLFQFSHKFILDRWWHMRQMPICDPLGHPILQSVGAGGTTRQVAASVVFVQGFKDQRDFFQMSPNFRGRA
jgi:hypothetical protein